MSESTSLIEKLENIDKRVIYWLLITFMAIPFISPIGLPVTIATTTRESFNIVDNLNEGDVVAFNVVSTAVWGELGPSQVVIFKHLLQKKCKVVMYGIVMDAPMGIKLIIDNSKSFIDEVGAEYGVDYVNMGYFAGMETAIASLAVDTPGTMKASFEGTPISQLPIMEGIENAGDFALVIDFDSEDQFVFYARHWISNYDVEQIVIGTGWAEPAIIPYWNAGMVKSFATGLNGGAGWEILAKMKGEAVIGLDAISTSHLFFLFVVLFGNLIHFIKRSKKGGSV